MRLVQRAKDAAAARLRARFADGRFRARTVVGAPGADGLPVLMCAWARIDRLHEVLETLDDQLTRVPIDLWIWNNNRAEHAALLEAIARRQPGGAIRSISAFRSPFNLGSIARFYLARQLWLAGRRGPFIVFDDDQRLPADFVSIAMRSFSVGTASGVWAWQVTGEYWQRRRAQPGERVDHLGPGGMIADLAVVSDRGFFDGLPLEHWYLDDVWFSHWAPEHGFELRRLPAEVAFIDDDHNLYPHVVQQKIDFHDRLVRQRSAR